MIFLIWKFNSAFGFDPSFVTKEQSNWSQFICRNVKRHYAHTWGLRPLPSPAKAELGKCWHSVSHLTSLLWSISLLCLWHCSGKESLLFPVSCCTNTDARSMQLRTGTLDFSAFLEYTCENLYRLLGRGRHSWTQKNLKDKRYRLNKIIWNSVRAKALWKLLHSRWSFKTCFTFYLTVIGTHRKIRNSWYFLHASYDAV